jgi:chromosome segregation protein
VFFADASSGAGSTAFVRQGQIGLLINQKPLARRSVLEEAAGIGGLHQRRHEAELRLKAAETNMARLDDIIREVEAGLQNLRKQARQAARYRNLSGLIRKAEALALHLRWQAAQAQQAEAEGSLNRASADVAERADRAALVSTRQAEAAAKLPPLRQVEAERGAALHRLVLQREALDAEENRAREEAQRLRQRLAQTEQDLDREHTLDADAQAALQTLESEAADLDAATVRADAILAEAQSQATGLANTLAERERTLERLTSELAEWHAQKSGQERTREIASALVQSTEQQLQDAQAKLEAALAEAAGVADVKAAEQAADDAAREAEAARLILEEARAQLERAERA